MYIDKMKIPTQTKAGHSPGFEHIMFMSKVRPLIIKEHNQF